MDEPTKNELSELIKTHKSATEWASTDHPEMLQALAIRLAHPRYESTLLVPLVINKTAIGGSSFAKKCAMDSTKKW
ncbi:hypothetical protein [Algoriphagus boritolerans]|uniref:hypothetical protein n=1 Tax=Algoriphagus boritolerans TaxID=308111 RepID=UPI000AD3C6D3